MDFLIHTLFENRHITITVEDVKFYDDGFEGIIGIIDFNDSGELDELSEDEFFVLNPKGEDFVYSILNKLSGNKESYIDRSNPQKTILLVF